MADIFISYDHADRAEITKLSSALEVEGFSVWSDRDIASGTEFSRVIEVELDAASHVVVVWSSASLNSHWVRDEADYAREKGKLLPISLDGVLPPIGFRQIHSLNFDGWDGETSAHTFQALLQSFRGELNSPAAIANTAAPTIASTGPSSRKPSIAVLPFENMSTDKEQGFLADGLTEDIITALSTNRHLSVAARTSTFAYKGVSIDIREVGRELNARYVVEGSVRKIGPRLRVTVQFIDAESGAHIWAKNYDALLEEFNEAPDEIVEKITASLGAQLIWTEADRAELTDDSELGAWELIQKASAAVGRSAGSRATMLECVAQLKRATDLEPDSGLAHALLSWFYNAAITNSIFKDKEYAGFLENAKRHLRVARDLAGNDYLCLMWIGASENYGGMNDRSLHTLRQVIDRNPANAEAYFHLSQTYAFMGRFDEARQAIMRAAELSPEAGFGLQHDWYRGIIEYFAGNYEEALPFVLAQVTNFPEYGIANACAAMLYALTGDEENALKYITRLRQYNPQMTAKRLSLLILNQQNKEKGARENALMQKLWEDEEALAAR